MEKREVTNEDVFSVMNRDIEDLKYLLKHYLDVFGIRTSSQSLTDLINDVSKINAMIYGESHTGYQLDKNGYVINSFKIDGFTREDIPKDFSSGYYKMSNTGQFEIDYERKRQLEEV